MTIMQAGFSLVRFALVVVDPGKYLRALELTGGEPPLESVVGRVTHGATAVGIGSPLPQVTTEPSRSS